MFIRIYLLLLLALPCSVFAGTWTSHISHNDVRAIAFEGDNVWCGTTGGVVRWNKRDGACLIFSMRDGIVSDDVRAVAVDSNGNKWFGTSAGVSVYDGSAWTTYTAANVLADNDILAIEIGLGGKVWVGSKTGVSMFDGQKWTKWTASDVPSYSEGKFTDISSIAFGMDGTVWCSAGYIDGSQVLWVFDGASWKHQGSKAKTVRTDNSGKLWCTYYAGMRTDYLITLPGDSIIYHENPDFMAGYRLYADFTVDSQNAIWLIRNHSVGLSSAIDLVRYDGLTWSAFTPSVGEKGTVFKEWMHVIRVDDEGIVWIGSERGLLRFDGSKWDIFLDGLVHNSAGWGTLDRNGILWIVSRGMVSSFDGLKWEPYGKDSDFLVDYQVASIAVDDRNVKWFGAEKGIIRFDGNSWSFHPFPEGESEMNPALMTADHSGVLWFFHERNDSTFAVSFDGKNWEFRTGEHLQTGTVESQIAVDRDNQKWFLTDKNLVCFKDQSWKSYPLPGGMNSRYVDAMYFDSEGTLWAGVYSKLYHFDGQTWRAFDRLSSESVRSIARDRNGVIWLGSLSGVERFDGEQWRLLTTADGLVNGTANTVLVDKRNTKWFCTLGGISAYMDDVTGISENSHPSTISLATFPNPFNPSTAIEFTLPVSGETTLAVYSLSGQRIRTLISGTLDAGGHSAVWDGRDERGRAVSSGVYFARIATGKATAVRKMVLVR